MKQVIWIAFILMICSCDSEQANDCFQKAGPIIQQDIVVSVFDKILVNRDIELVVKDGPEQKVVLETGKNLIQDVAVIVVDNRQYDISSDGVLSYPSLTILSENFGAKDTFVNANFNLQVDNNTFRVVFNNLSNCFVSGKTNNLNITFASGTSRFEGRDLTAQNVKFWNRGSNDMIVNPQQSITGTISGTGDVISVNAPPDIDVEQLYTGRLIFE